MTKHAPHSLRPDPANLPASSPLADPVPRQRSPPNRGRRLQGALLLRRSYEILAGIGAGGRGEVYRTRNTKVQRDAAIKVLPQAFASDPDRMRDSSREAKVLAFLNHPIITAIYGDGRVAGRRGDAVAPSVQRQQAAVRAARSRGARLCARARRATIRSWLPSPHACLPIRDMATSRPTGSPPACRPLARAL